MRRLNRLKDGVDAKGEMGQVDPTVLMPQTFGLDDADQSAGDDWDASESVILFTLSRG